MVIFVIDVSHMTGLWIIYLLERKDGLVPTSVTIDNEQKEVLEVGNAIATMRLLKDLKAISRKKPAELVIHTSSFNLIH